MEEELLPVSLIRQYFYCPQIPYINLVLHVQEPETDSMLYGKEAHEVFRAQHLPREIEPIRIETEVHLTSERLGLVGVLDALVETTLGELVPCELKASALGTTAPPLKDRAQLAAYAMLVEENFRRTVKRGVLFYRDDGRKAVVLIDGSLRRLVMRAVAEIRGMLESERRPERGNPRACGSCWYRRMCPLRLPRP